jgi:hypothetical protein
MVVFQLFAVGIPVARHPPHRSQRAALPHWAPALGHDAKALLLAVSAQAHVACQPGAASGAWFAGADCPWPAVFPPPPPPTVDRPQGGWPMSLFGGFVGTIRLSDFPWSFIIGLRP